ncbi:MULTISPECIES: isoprenylcysteine carboxylmethyltransferase family protein [unclassified Sinorhizobium]|uniref:methyltransferase family protein n=1 Tax=unclassified Sinorhizobium TaxID=2613772 RepID=UPI0035245D87
MIVYLLQLVAWMVFMAVLLLWPAGTFAYPAAWILIGIFAIGGVAMIVWLSKRSPRLLRERMALPVQRAQEPWDRIWLSIFMLAFFVWMAFMSWDAARNSFTAIPAWLQMLGGLAIVLEMLGVAWTFRENTFAAPVVKIQEDQRVIDTGPYAAVRHPMYASALLFFIGLPLLLGSWIGLALSILFILGMAWRAVHEERALRAKLTGYEDYAARVPYRFVPYVW